MPVTRHVASCRWATPTLFTLRPFWLAAEDNPWTCVRSDQPRPIEDTVQCKSCGHWEPEPSPEALTIPDVLLN